MNTAMNCDYHPKFRALDDPPQAHRLRPRLAWPLIWGALAFALADLAIFTWFIVEWYPALPGVPTP